MKHFTNTNQLKKSNYYLTIKSVLIMAILVFSGQLSAQNGIEISGQIKGKKSSEDLIYCSIAVLNNADSLITGGITNSKGFFTIPVNRGNYKLAYSYMGYVADTIDIGYVADDKFLGTFKMEEDLQYIDEVEITASSRESSIDKDMQIITEDMRKGASDAKDEPIHLLYCYKMFLKRNP